MWKEYDASSKPKQSARCGRLFKRGQSRYRHDAGERELKGAARMVKANSKSDLLRASLAGGVDSAATTFSFLARRTRLVLQLFPVFAGNLFCFWPKHRDAAAHNQNALDVFAVCGKREIP